jgi:histidine triad (HIT) family protein
MDCPFCAIAAGRAEAAVVLRAGGVTAFLDARPLFKGHVLVIPDAHAATLADLPSEMVAPLFGTVQRVARAVERGLGADGSFVAMNNTISQSVPHLHVHVVPRRKGDGLRGFFWPRQRYSDETEREAVRRAIADALAP